MAHIYGLNVYEDELRKKYKEKYFANDEDSFQLFISALRMFNKELRKLKTKSVSEYKSVEFNQMVFCLFEKPFFDFYRNINVEVVPVTTDLMNMYVIFKFDMINVFRMELEKEIIQAIENDQNSIILTSSATQLNNIEVIKNVISIIEEFDMEIYNFNYKEIKYHPSIKFSFKLN